ncbi:hypothetical protein DFJ74DRAFT_111582 [Hyaloraphidium curvatum]|nr:hypothetical protein DFJ74DRAFT_111582 [Hyaloraphidium curvatum]
MPLFGARDGNEIPERKPNQTFRQLANLHVKDPARVRAAGIAVPRRVGRRAPFGRQAAACVDSQTATSNLTHAPMTVVTSSMAREGTSGHRSLLGGAGPSRRRRWIELDEDISIAEEEPETGPHPAHAGAADASEDEFLSSDDLSTLHGGRVGSGSGAPPSAPPMHLVLQLPPARQPAQQPASAHAAYTPPTYNPHVPLDPPPAYHELYPTVPLPPVAEYPRQQAAARSKEDREHEDALLAMEIARRERIDIFAPPRGGQPSAPDAVDLAVGLSLPQRRASTPPPSPGTARIFELPADGTAPLELRRLETSRDPAFHIPTALESALTFILSSLPELNARYLTTVRHLPTFFTSLVHPPAGAEDDGEWELADRPPAAEGEVPFGHYPCRSCQRRGRHSTRHSASRFLPRAVARWVPDYQWVCSSCGGTGMRRTWWYASGRVVAKAAKGVVWAGSWFLVKKAAEAGGLGGGWGAGVAAWWVVRKVGRAVAG